MRVVLDTNIYISTLISREGVAAQSLSLWIAKQFDLVTSHEQIEELRRVSRYDRVATLINRAEVGSLVNALRAKALVVGDLPEVDASPDPDDNVILATALAGEAQYLVTGDKADLLSLEKVQGVRIITVRSFVEAFA